MKKITALVLLCTIALTGCSSTKSQTEVGIAALAKTVTTALTEGTTVLEDNLSSLGQEFTGGTLSTETLSNQAQLLQTSKDSIVAMQEQITKITNSINSVDTLLSTYSGNNKTLVSIQENITRINEFKTDYSTKLDSLLATYDSVLTMHNEAVVLHTELDEIRLNATKSGTTYTYFNSADATKANSLISQINEYAGQINDTKNTIPGSISDLQEVQLKFIKAIKDIVALLEKV